MAKKSPKDAPLAVKVTGGKLIIEIGIDTLAFACDPANGGKLGNWKVKDGSELEWAKDVAHEMEHEEGDFEAQSRIGNWLDEMCDHAAENGSCALEENDQAHRPGREQTMTTDCNKTVETAEARPGSVQRFVRGHVSATLILGDSESIELPNADALVSDPPYGHGYKANGCCMVEKGGWKPTREPQAMEWNEKPFDPARWLKYPIVILWGANHYASRLPDSPAWYVWDKRDGVGENNLADCELAWCNVGGSARLKRHLWMGLCRDSEIGAHHHPTQKPVVVMAWAMDKAKIPQGATVLDPYMGSGSTGIACLRTGRNFVGVERDAEYYKTACARFAQECDGALL